VVVPLPDALPDGLPVTVQETPGKPLNATLPVDVEQVGWVIRSMIGDAGVELTVKVLNAGVGLPQPVTV